MVGAEPAGVDQPLSECLAGAVPPDYEEHLVGFVLGKKSHLAGLLAKPTLAAA